jgi:3-oxoacyl-[acyl-carrier protein] reductase
MSGKRVLVTGSSRGIGRAIALRMAQDGWRVAVHYSQAKAQAEAVCAELGAAEAGCYRADLAERTAPGSLWEEALSDGPVHAVVNNAGVYEPIRALEADEAAFEANLERTFAINWYAPLRLTRLAVRHFAAQGGGKVLNVASRAGFRGEAGAAAYSASKAALINLTRAWAVELARSGVQLFAIAPGWVETAMAREGMEARLPEILRDIPAGRMATPEDCAEAAAFLLSEGVAYLTGVTLDVNGASYFH